MSRATTGSMRRRSAAASGPSPSPDPQRSDPPELAELREAPVPDTPHHEQQQRETVGNRDRQQPAPKRIATERERHRDTQPRNAALDRVVEPGEPEQDRHDP